VEILRALAQAGLSADALEAAERLEVIAFVGDRVEFRHPLVRSAVLAFCYPQLPALRQQWYAIAPQTATSIRTQWPLLNPGQRAAMLRLWAMDLPYMSWMVDPVLAEASPRNQAVQRSQIDDLRTTAKPPALTDAEAIDALNREMQNNINPQNLATQMTANTLNLMDVMSGRDPSWTVR
jgi:hypothetical protein